MNGLLVSVALGMLPVTLLAFGALLVGLGAERQRAGMLAAGVALAAAIIGLSVLPGSWDSIPASIAPPSAMVAALMLYAHGRRTGAVGEWLAGAILMTLVLALASAPLFQLSEEEDPSIVATAVGWPAVGAVTFVIAIERLRRGPWTGWIPYVRGVSAPLAAAIGFSLLVLFPAVAAISAALLTT